MTTLQTLLKDRMVDKYLLRYLPGIYHSPTNTRLPVKAKKPADST